MTWRPLPSRQQCRERLLAIFPRETFDTVLSSPLAAAAVAALIYVDAVVDDEAVINETTRLANPSTCLWLSDVALAHDHPAEREAWYRAALRGHQAVREVERSWGVNHQAWYGDNSRETLRDETFQQWLGYGAVRVRRDLPTTSSKPRWALAGSFADLFRPGLVAADFDQAMQRWTDAHLTTSARIRLQTLFQRERLSQGVPVILPGTGQQRLLEPGGSSVILKGVLEQWAPQRLGDPDLLALSEPGDKVYLTDQARLAALGIVIDERNLLPDALLSVPS